MNEAAKLLTSFFSWLIDKSHEISQDVHVFYGIYMYMRVHVNNITGKFEYSLTFARLS